MFRCVFSIFLFLLFLVPVLAWGELADTLAELEQIKARIEQAEKKLEAKERSELEISRELAVLGRTLKRIDARLTELNSEQDRLQKEIDQLQQQIDETQVEIRRVTGRLEKRLAALYKEGDIGPLKVLFSAESPTEMVQQYNYLTRVLEHDKVLLADYRELVATHTRQLTELEALEQQQTALIAQQKKQRAAAGEGRKLQNRLLTQARKEKKKLEGELEDYRESAARLEKLIERLKQEPEVELPPAVENFAEAKGRLGWPVEGEVLIGFGTQKDNKLGTLYESNGFEIAVKPGSPILAVAGGKIVFADYFKSYGNLYIVSHPGGFHTLYAQTDRMQKKLGDSVSAGELLGYSGFKGRESIYFEIRSNGSPVDPADWLAKKR
ncbi:MAG: hypothetical protein C0622_10755 [Desulfuromonas sp.]|nr:MAG: hypothetical protein C0622_10755 [Desulfuromonas sp.]